MQKIIQVDIFRIKIKINMIDHHKALGGEIYLISERISNDWYKN